MREKRRRFTIFCILCAMLVPMVFYYCSGTDGYDPVSMDPPETDEEFPAQLIEPTGELMSGGKKLNGIIYLAQGKGPHPVIVLLHGLPGNERNLDLAHALRRAGWNVFFFHYRGAWGSEGEFLFSNCVEDVSAIIDYIKGEKVRQDYRTDADRIVLIGHSMGGAAALIAGAENNDVKGIISIAGANMSLLAQSARDEESRREISLMLENMLPLRMTSGESFIKDLEENQEKNDNLNHVEALAAKSLFLISGNRDEVVDRDIHIKPLADSLRAVYTEDFTYLMLDGNHSFSDKRITLTRHILAWLQERFR